MQSSKLLFWIFAVSQLVIFCKGGVNSPPQEAVRHPSIQSQSKLILDSEKVSPKGTYRVKVEVSTQPKKGSRENTEVGQYVLYKGHEILYTQKWEDSDQYEPTFREITPDIEWISDHVLRMGEHRTDQPFYDEVLLLNKTNETLKYVSVGYGKRELFWLLEVAAGGSVTLKAMPRFKPDGTSNYFVSYGGMAQSGKEFEGVLEKAQRKSESDGPFRFDIAVSENDLH